MLISFLNDVDVQLILEFKNSFEKFLNLIFGQDVPITIRIKQNKIIQNRLGNIVTKWASSLPFLTAHSHTSKC